MDLHISGPKPPVSRIDWTLNIATSRASSGIRAWAIPIRTPANYACSSARRLVQPITYTNMDTRLARPLLVWYVWRHRRTGCLNRPPQGVDDVWHLATNEKTLVQPHRCDSSLCSLHEVLQQKIPTHDFSNIAHVLRASSQELQKEWEFIQRLGGDLSSEEHNDSNSNVNAVPQNVSHILKCT